MIFLYIVFVLFYFFFFWGGWGKTRGLNRPVYPEGQVHILAIRRNHFTPFNHSFDLYLKQCVVGTFRVLFFQETYS